MQRPTSRWLPVLVMPLIALGLEGTGRANPIEYMSEGDIGVMTGAPIGNYELNPTSGSLLGPGTISLATFQTQGLPDGAGLTYTNMPFYINVNFYPQAPNLTADPSELTIQGVLNGTVTGTNSSNVVATLTSIESTGLNPLPFSLSSFNVLTPQTLAPSGTTSLAVQVTNLSIPEPTPMAMLGILAGWAAYRRLLRCGRDAKPSPSV